LAKQRRLPLEFVLIGCVDRRVRPRSEPFRQTGRYDNQRLLDLLAQVRPHLVWFPGCAPETYSFTLSAALHAGLPVVVPNIGAAPERVAGLSWAWIVPSDWDAMRMNTFFLDISRQNFIPQLAPGLPAARREAPADFYRSTYLMPMLDRKSTGVRDIKVEIRQPDAPNNLRSGH
jgi:hypothetical protein